MNNCTNKFNLYYFLSEVHNLALEISEKRYTNAALICAQFSHSSLYETISMAKAFLFESDDPAIKQIQLQLKSDITILTEYLISSKTNWRQAAALHTIFGKMFGLQPPRKENNFGEVSRATLQEAIDFLNDFAPNRARVLQMGLKSKPVQVLYRSVVDEIELHIGQIAKAIAKRYGRLSMYMQPGTFNKLVRIKKNLSILIKLLTERRFNEPEKCYLAVYVELSAERDCNAIGTKTIQLLESLYEEVASYCRIQQKHVEDWQLKTIGEFMAHCAEGAEPSRKSILELFTYFLQSAIPTDWFHVLKSNPAVCTEIQTFCNQFCREEEHAAKIRLFHNFFTEWLEKYAPDSKVGAEEILVYIQSILLLANSPELLLDILLLEQDSISFQPNAPALMDSDYTPEELPTASGINCYDYLNLSTALLAMCRRGTEEEMEVEMLQKKGGALYKKFNAHCNLGFFSPPRLSSNKDDLKAQLLQSVKAIHVIYSDVISAFKLPSSWQSDLSVREDFIKDASFWADNFCSEHNSIVKLNQHRDMVSKMVQKYHPHPHQPVDFLAALLKAANNPGIITAVTLIEREALGWKISEGLIGDTPVSAKHRKDDLQVLQALIDQLKPIPTSDFTKDN